jgi:hypothetical protein
MKKTNSNLPVMAVNNAIQLDGFKFKSMELSIEGQHEIEKWLEVGTLLTGMESSLNWWIGDWLVFGEHTYGQKYSQAESVTKHRQDYLKACNFVSSKVPASNRIVGLSWSHHREVAALPVVEQKKWLTQALENEWTVSELRINMRKSLAEYSSDDDETTKSFNLVSWTQVGVRWLRQETRKAPVENWSSERRDLIKKDLEPIVEFYGKL